MASFAADTMHQAVPQVTVRRRPAARQAVARAFDRFVDAGVRRAQQDMARRGEPDRDLDLTKPNGRRVPMGLHL